jgi:hypothetical protein
MSDAANKKTIQVHVAADTEEFDVWVRSLRLLVSQIGFALDGYLAGRPSPNTDSSS